MSFHLIVGLGNPGAEYAHTRHNAGAWLIARLAEHFQTTLRHESKFKAQVARINSNDQECWLLIPNTFMNLSGQAVHAICQFYKIPTEEILVAHDELDFLPGTIRLKKGGGSGGHNGLKDITEKLSSPDYYRLRIGIGHPGDRHKVLDYVLNAPSKTDKTLIETAFTNFIPLLPDLITGKTEKVMQELHTKL